MFPGSGILMDWPHRMSMFDIALDYQRERDRFPKLRHLDYRELTLARLLAGGCGACEAGIKLGLNVETAEAMRRDLLRKLGLASEGELCALVGTATAASEVAYVEDFRTSYFRPTARAVDGDVVFAD
jgi:DNA-binding CsgD family transcriptional regulator